MFSSRRLVNRSWSRSNRRGPIRLDLERGVFQCVKCRAALQAQSEVSNPGSRVTVRALLVSEQPLGSKLAKWARKLDVEGESKMPTSAINWKATAAYGTAPGRAKPGINAQPICSTARSLFCPKRFSFQEGNSFSVLCVNASSGGRLAAKASGV
jgi:hypothetical protein